MLWFVIVLKYSLSNHNITSPLSYNIAILPLSHHITGIIAGQVHRVHLNMCKCLGNSYPKNMFSIFLNLHSQSVMFLAKCNLVVLCQKKARFFFFFLPPGQCAQRSRLCSVRAVTETPISIDDTCSKSEALDSLFFTARLCTISVVLQHSQCCPD